MPPWGFQRSTFREATVFSLSFSWFFAYVEVFIQFKFEVCFLYNVLKLNTTISCHVALMRHLGDTYLYNKRANAGDCIANKKGESGFRVMVNKTSQWYFTFLFFTLYVGDRKHAVNEFYYNAPSQFNYTIEWY